MFRTLSALVCLAVAPSAKAQIEFSVEADRDVYAASDTLRLTYTVVNTTQDPVTLPFGSYQTLTFQVGDLEGPFGYCGFLESPRDILLGPGESVDVGAGNGAGFEGDPDCYDLVLDDPHVLALAPGDYVVAAQLLTENVGGVTAMTTITLMEPVSSAPDAAETGFSLGPGAPNPTAGSTTLALRVVGSQQVRLDVLDVLGRVVRSMAVAVSGERRVPVDLADLPPGAYVVRATSGDAVRMVSVVRSH